MKLVGGSTTKTIFLPGRVEILPPILKVLHYPLLSIAFSMDYVNMDHVNVKKTVILEHTLSSPTANLE